MKALRCFFKGHSDTEVCTHCGKHDYYDSFYADPGCRYTKHFWNCYEFTIPSALAMLRIWFNWKKDRFFRKCQDCGKPEFRFGRNVGDHSKCLPF